MELEGDASGRCDTTCAPGSTTSSFPAWMTSPTLGTWLAGVVLVLWFAPTCISGMGRSLGALLQLITAERRLAILAKNDRDGNDVEESESDDGEEGTGGTDEFSGLIGFFHPFCNAGGGGERVLWAAVKATQDRWPCAQIVVYTGDDVAKEEMISHVKKRFNIEVHPRRITFLLLSTRKLLLGSTWPYFTLLGQSIGSMVVAWNAFSIVVPDVFIDTMGYAFSLGLSKLLFPEVPTVAYVHYPTISTDMLSSLDPNSPTGTMGVNASQGGATIRGRAKRMYWQLFARLYSRMGATIDLVMANSSWTQGHLHQLWSPVRQASKHQLKKNPSGNPISQEIKVVFPPVAVEELEEVIPIVEGRDREPIVLYIAQFRPEKNHELIIHSFAEFAKGTSPVAKKARLVLIGSVRDAADAERMQQLETLATARGVSSQVDFVPEAPWPEVQQWLGRASIGVNGMWNEHFGIGVVEYQAAGLICIVHNSGGPKLDIVTAVDGQPTGYHAETAQEFADTMATVFALEDTYSMRLRARHSARRFTENVFAQQWLALLEPVIQHSMRVA